MQEQITKLLNLQPDKKIQNYAFSMQAVIGRGSYGIVYVGRQIDTGSPVALKVVSITQVQCETLNLIQKEADIMKDLDSQNVVKLIDVLRTGNNYYIISELCTGGDLKEYMKRSGAMDEKIALPILTQILRGILQSFKRGIIHRDLKPANILLHYQKQNQVLFKIADFGFAKRFNHLENDLMTSLVGTPLYMSPQVLLRRQYTAKCDIWSVGLIYYELLEGRTPWNVFDILDLINKQKLTKITFSKRISKHSQQFILGCLQYDEKNRYSWEQIFTHPVFEGVFEKAQSPKAQQVYVPLSKKTSATIIKIEPQQTTEQGRQTERTKIKTLPQKRSVSPNNYLVAPLRVKTMSNCKTYVKSPGQTILKANNQVSPLNEDRPTVKPHRNVECQQQFPSEPTKEYQTELFVPYKKERTVSIVNRYITQQDQVQTQSQTPNSGSDNKLTSLINRGTNSSFTSFDKIVLDKKSSQPLTQQDSRKENQQQYYSGHVPIPKTQQSNYQHNLILNYLSEEFNQNKIIIQNNLDYLRYLKQLQICMKEHFPHKQSPVMFKLQFLLAKHAMIKSTDIKVNMIDRKQNCLDLKEFKRFTQGDIYGKLEKQIVETHFEIFSHYQENFLRVNENLNLIIDDQDFLDLFNNQFEANSHFTHYAYQLSQQFIKESFKNLITDSTMLSLLMFCHAMLVYWQHMKAHTFSQDDINRVLKTLQDHNSGFLGRYDKTNIPGLRYDILCLLNKLDYS